jgi:hypothetical protein
MMSTKPLVTEQESTLNDHIATLQSKLALQKALHEKSISREKSFALMAQDLLELEESSLDALVTYRTHIQNPFKRAGSSSVKDAQQLVKYMARAEQNSIHKRQLSLKMAKLVDRSDDVNLPRLPTRDTRLGVKKRANSSQEPKLATVPRSSIENLMTITNKKIEGKGRLEPLTLSPVKADSQSRKMSHSAS